MHKFNSCVPCIISLENQTRNLQGRIELNSYALTLGQKRVSGNYSWSMDDLRQAAQLLAVGNFETGWATRYTLQEGEAGFRDMLKGEGNKIKAILQC